MSPGAAGAALLSPSGSGALRVTHPDPAVAAGAETPGGGRPTDEYVLLKRLIAGQGLLEKQPAYYLKHGAVLVAILVATLGCIALSTTTWLRLLCAIPAAFLFGQLGFLAHDATHGQIFRNSRRNHGLGLLLFNLCLGGSRGWWADKHNRHHSFPNQLGRDPDTEFSVIALSEGQAAAARGLPRLMMRFQIDTVVPLLCLEALNIHFHSFRFLWHSRMARIAGELSLLVLHYAIYLTAVMLVFGLSTGLLFIAIHQLLLGLYLSVAFITNHIGMPVLDVDEAVPFLRRQVLTARNIRHNRATDFLFGYLTCQIEHHLFPAMPRNRLRAAAPIVRDFCRQRGIEYRETGLFEAYGQVRTHLIAVAPSLRWQ